MELHCREMGVTLGGDQSRKAPQRREFSACLKEIQRIGMEESWVKDTQEEESTVEKSSKL